VTTGIYLKSVNFSFLLLVQRTVVGGILLAADEQFWVEERSVGSSTNLINGLYLN
jgi:hypothetical protein